jgi:hypothetical protein
VEDDVTIIKEIGTRGKQKPYIENSTTYYRKIMWTKNSPHFGFLQAISSLRRKVLQSTSKTR